MSTYNALLLANGKWGKVSLPTPPTPPSQLLMNVTCTAGASCVATGAASGSKFNPNTGWGDAFLVAGSGVVTVRRVVPPKEFVGYDSHCSGTSHCLMVGKVFTGVNPAAIVSGTLEMRDEKVSRPLGRKHRSGLSGISCPASNTCYAVGYLTVGRRNQEAVVVEGNGTNWHRMPLPHLDGHSSSLQSISCASVTSCVAVGEITRDGVPSRPLALEMLDGSWSTMSISQAVLNHGDFTAVTCFTATECLAVGDGSTSTSSPTSGGTAASFQGGDWQVIQVPKVAISMDHLACLNSDECFAIAGQDIIEFKR
ncbi:MAG: hypothetical protein M0Z95_10180 [Actinomycetota bacterium]|nr:hypothetical protein [Actinomycetota bacterium]